MRKRIGALVGVALVGAGLMVTQAEPAQGRPAPVKVSSLVDCEDQNVQPCITFDDGKWRLVLSYQPYTARVVKKCASPAVTPCFRHFHDTYHYLWRTTF